MSTNIDGVGVSQFGMKVGPEVLATTGKHIYVHHTGSALSNGINPRLPVVPTLDGAVGKCRANKGDVIILLPGHAETIATATALALDVAGITVVNMSQTNPAVFSLSATDSTIAVSAANIRVLGFPIVKATINNVAAGFTISAADVELNVETRDTSATVEFISPFVTTAAADRLKLNVKHVGFLAGAVGTRYIDLVGANSASINVDYFGVSSVAVVNMRSTVSDNVRVTGKFHNGTTALTKNVVDSVGTSTWSVEGFDVVQGSGFSGAYNTAVAADDASAIASALTVPSADASTNTNERDVVGNKTDAAVYAVGSTSSLEAYAKGILHSHVLATGTLTTSSTTVPADTGRTEVDNYWQGCLLVPLTGSAAFQPRLITSFANTGGVFTLNSDKPFTTAPGTVAYAIIPHQGVLAPTADSTATGTTSLSIGNKADAAVRTIGTTASIMAYIKGMVTGSRKTAVVTLANTDMTGTTTRFTITNGPIKVWSLGMLVTTAIPAGANTLKFSFTPTGGSATDLSGATDTASAGAQQQFFVDGTKATGLVKTTDVGIRAAGQADHMPIELSSGVVQTIFSAGAPASGAAVVYIEYEPLNPANAVA